MVVYNLACANSHVFEGWFASPEAFDEQLGADSVSCPVCGSSAVERQPSAPYIAKRSNAADQESTEIPAAALQELQAKVLDYVIKNSEDVGKDFPDEARRIQSRDAPARAIRGQATGKQVKELKDEGIDVMALPLAPVPPDRLH